MTELLDANRQDGGRFSSRNSHGWTDSQAMTVAEPRTRYISISRGSVPLRSACEESARFRCSLTEERDSQAINRTCCCSLKAYLDEHHDNATCTIYQMSKGKSRLRSVNDEDEIPTLFQGANFADTAHKDVVYPGDDKERGAAGVTIQLHTLQVRQKGRGPLIADNVPTIAVWIPPEHGFGLACSGAES